MSLASSPDYLFRPEDKALKMLFPSIEEPSQDPFDDFFDKELYNLLNNDKEEPLVFETFLANEALGTPKIVRTNPNLSGPETKPWRDGLWCLRPEPSTELVINKTRKQGGSAPKFVAPSHLTNNGSLTTEKALSNSKFNTKIPFYNPKTAKLDNSRTANRPMSQGQALSSIQVATQSISNTQMAATGKWRGGFLDCQTEMPALSNASNNTNHTQHARQEAIMHKANAQSISQNAMIANTAQSPTKYHYPFQAHTVVDNDFPDPRGAFSKTQGQVTAVTTSNINQLHNTAYSTLACNQYDMPVWTTESLDSSDSSYQSQGSQYSYDGYQAASTNPAAMAWSPPLPSTTVPLPLMEIESDIAAPTPRRLAHHVLNQQEQFQGGLGIRFPDLAEIGVAVSSDLQQSLPTQRHALTPLITKAEVVQPYPPLPPYPSNSFEDMSLFTTPQHRRATEHFRTPSPTFSPTHKRSSRSTSQRSPARTEYTQSRRKSMHKPGPIRDSSQNDPSGRRSRSRSVSRAPRTPKTPKTPKTPSGANFANLDFVNFTPQDSAKLMSDVAPSGSSKTRARREQEAKEKRKKLNEAALQAIMRAGGDVSVFEGAVFV